MSNSMIRVENDKVFVKLSKEIYVEQAAMIREQLLQYIESNYCNVEFDFTDVTYIDSSGLGVLVAIHKLTSSHGGDVIIKGMNGEVKELFELTRLDKIFTIQ